MSIYVCAKYIPSVKFNSSFYILSSYIYTNDVITSPSCAPSASLKAAQQPHTHRCRRVQIEIAPRRFILSYTFASSSLRFARSEQVDVRRVQVSSFCRVLSLCVTVRQCDQNSYLTHPNRAAVSLVQLEGEASTVYKKPPLLRKTPYISSIHTQTDHIFSPILLPGLYWRLSNQSTNTLCSCAVCICCCW